MSTGLKEYYDLHPELESEALALSERIVISRK